MLKKKAAFLLLILLFFTGKVSSQTQGGLSSGEIKIIAHYKEKIKDQIFASGNVEVHYRNVKLFADRIELSSESKDVYAEGHVVIQTPDEVVSCEKIFFNLDSSQGKLENVHGMIQPTIFYEAESVERRDENLYSFRKARLTSCTQPVPRWKFSCSKANFKKDDYMEMWNSVFSIKGIPVFYLPYMRYPLDKERATGFLMPQLGYSGRKGFFFSESFFWAIKRNMDATFNIDYYSARGLGGGLEFRYIFSRGTTGHLNLYYFKFNKEQQQETPSSAHIIRFRHNQDLPLNFELVADIDLQSSYDFLREFDNNFKRAVVSNRRTQAYLSKAWSYYNFNIRVSRFETYYANKGDSVIRHDFPQIKFSSSKIKLFSPLYFSFYSSFDSWEHGWQSDYEKDKQKQSQSLAFSPSLSLPFTGIPCLSINTSLESNFNYYFQSYAPGTAEVVDEPLFSSNYVLNVQLIGPVFYRIYRDAEGTAKLKHIIEPFFTYTYQTPVDDPERIINYRSYFRTHQIRYGLTNRFLIKKDKMPREILTIALENVYYLSPEDGPLNIYLVDGEIPKYADVRGTVRFYPTTKYSLDFSGAWNPYHKTFSSLRLGANLGSMSDPLFLRVSWFKSINPYIESEIWSRHQIDGFAGIKIPKLSLEAMGEVSYNILERKMLYSGLNLVYHYQCLDFRAELRVFHFREEPEVQYRISFGLGNIGKTIDFLGGLGF
jgi:LPS-assembly protein